MKTTPKHRDAIRQMMNDAGWVSAALMNTVDGLKFPVKNGKLGAFVITVNDGESWSVYGIESDIQAWNDVIAKLSNHPAIQEFIQHVEDNEDYSLANDSTMKIILDAWWASELSNYF